MRQLIGASKSLDMPIWQHRVRDCLGCSRWRKKWIFGWYFLWHSSSKCKAISRYKSVNRQWVAVDRRQPVSESPSAHFLLTWTTHSFVLNITKCVGRSPMWDQLGGRLQTQEVPICYPMPKQSEFPNRTFSTWALLCIAECFFGMESQTNVPSISWCWARTGARSHVVSTSTSGRALRPWWPAGPGSINWKKDQLVVSRSQGKDKRNTTF